MSGTHLKITIEARNWKDRVQGRADQARRTRLAAALRDLASRIEIGAVEGRIERPDLIGTFELQLPAAPARDAA